MTIKDEYAKTVQKLEKEVDRLCAERLRGVQRKIRKRIARLMLEAEQAYLKADPSLCVGKLEGIIMGNGTWVFRDGCRDRRDGPGRNFFYRLPQHEELDELCGMLGYERGLFPFDMTLEEAREEARKEAKR
jgi:hypothetical protein